MKGESALAKLSGSTPVPFNGQKEFTFNYDKEVDIVAESGKKTPGGIKLEPVTILPIKMEYSARVSDEFVFGTEEYRINVLRSFSEGFGRKIARGIDIAAFHGLNPRTGAASSVVGANNFDSKIVQSVVGTANPENDMEAAISLIEAMEGTVSGAVFAPKFRSSLAAQKDNTGRRLYPELAWGQEVGAINGLPVTANVTLAFGASNIRAIVGDFAQSFRWGYSKQIPIRVIEFGNPDNNEEEGDLQGRNQVLVRGEVYVGWAILIPSNFAKIVEEEEEA